MTHTRLDVIVAEDDLEPAPARLTRARRAGSAAAMLVAPWGFVVANAAYAWIQLHGGRDEPGTEALAMYAEHPVLGRLAITAVLLGCLLVVPAVLGAMALARASASAFVGGSLMIAGYVCYFGVIMTNVLYVTMADSDGPRQTYGAVIDASESQTWTSWVFLTFVVGNLLGTVLLAVGLLRTRVVARWVGFAVLAWPVLHVAGLVAGSELFEVVGALAQAAGFTALARELVTGRSRARREVQGVTNP